MAQGGVDLPGHGPPDRVAAPDDAGSAEAQSAEPASCCILHHRAVTRPVNHPASYRVDYFARYRRILARAPHTCIEHQRPRPAGLRS